MNFFFTNQIYNIKNLIGFLAGPRLWIPKNDYPDFNYWLYKVEQELEKEIKTAILCFSDKILIGSILYQKHKTFKDILELKNMTIHPNYNGRYIGSFLLKNAEYEGKKIYNSKMAICDAKKKNIPISDFLFYNKYSLATTIDLYGLKAGDDNVFIKNL